MKQRATIDPLEGIAEAERALANATKLALALVNIAETIHGDRRFILQQISWSLQNELDVLSSFVTNQKESASPANGSSDRGDSSKAKRDG